MRVLSLFIIITMFLGHQSTAQDNNVKVNISSFLVGTAGVSYERLILKGKSGVQGNVNITYGYKYKGYDVTAWSVGLDYRRYLWRIEKLNGLYVSPFVRFQRITTKNSVNTHTANVRTLGVVLGRQLLHEKRFTIDLFAGPSLNSGSLKTPGDFAFLEKVNGLRFRAGLAIGYAF